MIKQGCFYKYAFACLYRHAIWPLQAMVKTRYFQDIALQVPKYYKTNFERSRKVPNRKVTVVFHRFEIMFFEYIFSQTYIF